MRSTCDPGVCTKPDTYVLTNQVPVYVKTFQKFTPIVTLARDSAVGHLQTKISHLCSLFIGQGCLIYSAYNLWCWMAGIQLSS